MGLSEGMAAADKSDGLRVVHMLRARNIAIGILSRRERWHALESKCGPPALAAGLLRSASAADARRAGDGLRLQRAMQHTARMRMAGMRARWRAALLAADGGGSLRQAALRQAAARSGTRSAQRAAARARTMRPNVARTLGAESLGSGLPCGPSGFT